ncbi:MAG: FecR domain-containing protein [Deltaproteobacteria bacterium]|nr:FecR domain-containing protein [Deltaproteobacteria bacterium]
MKRYSIVVVLALTLLFFGLQAALADTDPSRGNAAPAKAIPEELENLDVKDYYIASEAEPVGLIQTVTGHVVVLNRDTGEAYFAAAGDAVFQQDALFTLEESRCRIKFTTEDVITMGEDTRIEIEEFVDDHELQKKKSTIRMLKGKAMFYVVPLFRYKDVSTTVKTQTAVMGVRGTKFGVEVTFLDLAQTNTDDTETVVYGFEGQVEVYSYIDGATQMVGEGENLRVSSLGAGNVQDMDIGMAEQFMSDTEAPAPEGEEIGADDEGVEVQAEPADEEGEADSPVAVESDDSAAIPTDTGDFTDVTQDQTTATLDVWETWEGKTAGEGGYFATIITDAADGIAYNESSPVIKDPIYISHVPNLFSGGLETHIGYAVDHEGKEEFKMMVEEIDPNMDMKVTYFSWGNGSNIALGMPHLFKWNDGGCYRDENGHEYMEWGWWQDQDAPTGQIGEDGSDLFYAATARIWEVEGDFTHSDAISFLQQQNFSATYTGEAKGVYANSSASDVKILTGDFSCHIDFGNSRVSNFDINAGQVHISGGSGTLGSCGSFEVGGFTGTIDGNPIASEPDTGATGSCFGAKADGVGGLWYAHDGDKKWATGEFHGKR